MSKIRARLCCSNKRFDKVWTTWFINPNWKCRFIQYLMHVGYDLHSPLDQIGNVQVSLCHFFKLVHQTKLEKASKLCIVRRGCNTMECMKCILDA